jgi:hypothetical protein
MYLQSTYRSDQLQPRAHCSLGVVLVGVRVAEVDEDPVAHVIGPQVCALLLTLASELLRHPNLDDHFDDFASMVCTPNSWRVRSRAEVKGSFGILEV